jgi:hypothetical protein
VALVQTDLPAETMAPVLALEVVRVLPAIQLVLVASKVSAASLASVSLQRMSLLLPLQAQVGALLAHRVTLMAFVQVDIRVDL